jgi:hypothetical protein
MGGNDRPNGTSQTDIDAKLFKVLYELKLQLDTQFKEARQQNKEDTQQIVELAVSRAVHPVMSEIQGIKQQLQEGNRRFDEQSSKITKATSLATQAASDALVAKTERALPLQTVEEAKPKEGWISASTLVALLPALGSLIATILASIALMRAPAQSDQQASPQPATPTPANPVTATPP